MVTVRFNRIALKKQIEADFEQQFKQKTTKLVRDLEDATPVDTGLARDSWSIEFDSKNNAIIKNSQDYVEILNRGTSKQAPRFFIETAILNNGFKIKGPTTTKK
jgi:hypothetical protein